MNMKSWIVIFISILIISGCANPEAKRFKNDEVVQAEIKELIVSKGAEMYGLELNPIMEDMEFGRGPALPSVDSMKLVVPVKTTGIPEFTFNAIVDIGDTEAGEIGIKGVDIYGNPNGLGYLGNFLMSYVFQTKFHNEMDEILNYDKGIYLDRVMVQSKASIYIEDEEELEQMMRAITADYNAGKFNNSDEYTYLIDTYGLGGLPQVFIKMDQASDSAATEKKFNNLVAYMTNNKDLPAAEYHIKTYSTQKDVSTFSKVLVIGDKQ